MIDEWWIVGGFATITLIVVALNYALRHSEAPVILHGNGKHDDAPGLRAWLRGDRVQWASGSPVERRLYDCIFRVDSAWMVDDIDSPRSLVDCMFVYADGRTPEQITRTL